MMSLMKEHMAHSLRSFYGLWLARFTRSMADGLSQIALTISLKL